MSDKYKYTASELFKLRMQFKAEVNELRKTYHEVVLQKGATQKKHFYNPVSVPQTSIIPEPERSVKKITHEKRHYSPILYSSTNERKSMSCKKQFSNVKSIDNLSTVIAQQHQSKKKSLSQAIHSKDNKTTINYSTNYKTFTSQNQSPCNNNFNSTSRTGIKINPKYHQYDSRFFG